MPHAEILRLPTSRPTDLHAMGITPPAERIHISATPALTEMWSATRTSGLIGGVWLFAIPDDAGWLLSVTDSSTGTLYTCRLLSLSEDEFRHNDLHKLCDLSTFTTSPAGGGSSALTATFVGQNGTGTYTQVSDSWHIYVNDEHWIAVAVAGEYPYMYTDSSGTHSGTRSDSVAAVLCKMGWSFDATTTTRGGIIVPVGAYGIRDMRAVDYPSTAADYLPNALPQRPTNDLFLCEDSSGLLGISSVQAVAVGIMHWDPSGANSPSQRGHVVHRYDTNLLPLGQYALYGAGYAHCNGSSVVPAARGAPLSTRRQVLAPTSLSPTSSGDLQLLEVDHDWSPIDITTLKSSPVTSNYNQATAVTIQWHGEDYKVVAYRRIDLLSGGGSRGDDGEIRLEIWDSSNTMVYRVDPSPSTDGSRPHLSASDDHTVVLCWDELDGVHMSVYTLSFPVTGTLPGSRGTAPV